MIKDLRYAERDAHARQRLDLYLPNRSPSGALPLIVWAHGGSWVTGDKSEMPLLQMVGEEGFAVASVNYRFIDAAPLDAPLRDIKAAIRYLRKAAAEHGLDVNRFIGAGFSAGAHLIALATLTGDDPRFADAGDETSDKLRAAAIFGGVYDLTAMKIRPDSGLNQIGADKTDATDPTETMRLFSPINHVTPQSPPFFIQHGAEDDIVDHRQSLMFADKLKLSGVPHELHIVEALGHKMKLDARVKTAFKNLV